MGLIQSFFLHLRKLPSSHSYAVVVVVDEIGWMPSEWRHFFLVFLRHDTTWIEMTVEVSLTRVALVVLRQRFLRHGSLHTAK